MIDTKTVAAVCALTVLSACGGATTSTDGGFGGGGSRLSYGDIADIAADVNAGYRATAITPKALVPTTGAATYAGAVGGTIADTTVGGVMQADVNFTTNRIGGLMGNFVTEGGSDLDGTLVLRNGVLNRTSNSQQVAIFADVDGVLTSEANQSIVVDARLRNSGFKGNDVRFIGGDIEGIATIDGVDTVIDMRTQLERP